MPGKAASFKEGALPTLSEQLNTGLIFVVVKPSILITGLCGIKIWPGDLSSRGSIIPNDSCCLKTSS